MNVVLITVNAQNILHRPPVVSEPRTRDMLIGPVANYYLLSSAVRLIDSEPVF